MKLAEKILTDIEVQPLDEGAINSKGAKKLADQLEKAYQKIRNFDFSQKVHDDSELENKASTARAKAEEGILTTISNLNSLSKLLK